MLSLSLACAVVAAATFDEGLCHRAIAARILHAVVPLVGIGAGVASLLMPTTSAWAVIGKSFLVLLNVAMLVLVGMSLMPVGVHCGVPS